MTKKIVCQNKTKNKGKNVRVRIIKAPLVNTADLRLVLMARAKALVL